MLPGDIACAGWPSPSRTATRMRSTIWTGRSSWALTSFPLALTGAWSTGNTGISKLALADFQAVLTPRQRETPHRSRFFARLLYLQRGEIQRALDDFDAVIDENPRIRTVFLYRAQIHIAGRQRPRAKDLDTYLVIRESNTTGASG